MTPDLSRRAVCLGILTLLAGCAAPIPDARIWRGRFALRTIVQGRPQANSGRFELIRSRNFLRLDLLTPLSGVLARIEVTPERASLSRGISDPPIIRKNIDVLLAEVLGYSIPVEMLSDLLESPSASDTASLGRWRAEILARKSGGEPERIRIESSDNETTLTVFIESP